MASSEPCAHLNREWLENYCGVDVWRCPDCWETFDQFNDCPGGR